MSMDQVVIVGAVLFALICGIGSIIVGVASIKKGYSLGAAIIIAIVGGVTLFETAKQLYPYGAKTPATTNVAQP